MTSFTFSKPTLYNGYHMCFLEDPIAYRLKHSCRFVKTRFNYNLSNIHPTDIESINKLLHNIQPDLSIDYKKFYAKMQKTDVMVESPNIYKVVLLFTGYKEKNTVSSPIYSVLSAVRDEEKLIEKDITYWDEELVFEKDKNY